MHDLLDIVDIQESERGWVRQKLKQLTYYVPDFDIPISMWRRSRMTF